MIDYIFVGVQIFSALVAPTTAGIVTYIAYQQHKVNKQKLGFELYDRRLRVYEQVKDFIWIVLHKADVTDEQLSVFRNNTIEADFLFGKDGKEITDYINELFKRGIYLRHFNKQFRREYDEKPPDYDHTEVCDNTHKEIMWFTAQLDPAKEKFAKYLRIDG